MKRFLPILLALWVVWSYEPDVRDTVEFRMDVDTGKWFPIPGPYYLVNGKYWVEAPKASRIFLRVRREWGDPLLRVGEWPDKPKE